MLNLIDRTTHRLELNPNHDGSRDKLFMRSKSGIKTDYIPASSQRKVLEHTSETLEEKYIPSITL